MKEIKFRCWAYKNKRTAIHTNTGLCFGKPQKVMDGIYIKQSDKQENKMKNFQLLQTLVKPGECKKIEIIIRGTK